MRALSCCVAAIALGAASAAHADPRDVPRNPDVSPSAQSEQSAEDELPTLSFELAADALASASIQVTNGKGVTDPRDWDALVFASLMAPGVGVSGATCSGTLVGPYVLLTAAHCVDRGSAHPRNAKLTADGLPFTFVCEMHPAYAARPSRRPLPRGPEDYALCQLQLDRPPPPSLRHLRFAGIDFGASPSPGREVTLAGYGCTSLIMKDGQLTSPAFEPALSVSNAPLSASDRSGWIMVRSAIATEPALCPGDSGGPVLDAAVTSPLARNSIVAVNSWIRADTSPGGATDVLSYMSPTGAAAFVHWVDTWLAAHPNAVICGRNDTATSPCRN